MIATEERELRDRLVKRLRWDDVPEGVWQSLVDQGFVERARTSDPRAWSELERHARQLRKAQKAAERTKGQKRTPRPHRVDTYQTAYQRDRSEAVAEFLAHHAAATARVRQFRETYLSGRTLGTAEADASLSSQAPRFLSRAEFGMLGAPILGHATYVSALNEGRTEPAILELRWTEGGESKTATKILGSGRKPSEQLLIPGLPPQRDTPWETAEAGYDVIRVAPGSVFDELRALSEWLRRRYGWFEWLATWFVLTGAVPRQEPIRADSNINDRIAYQTPRITISVEPWMPAEMVLRAYRDTQAMLLGRENRQPADKAVELFRFVTRETLALQSPKKWETLMTEWNRAHPESRYTAVSLFHRDYKRAERALLRPVPQPAWDFDEGDDE